MGARQLRLKRHECTPQRLASLTGAIVDVVLTNGRAAHGRLIAVDAEVCRIADANARLEWNKGRAQHQAIAYADMLELSAITYAPW